MLRDKRDALASSVILYNVRFSLFTFTRSELDRHIVTRYLAQFLSLAAVRNERAGERHAIDTLALVARDKTMYSCES